MSIVLSYRGSTNQVRSLLRPDSLEPFQVDIGPVIRDTTPNPLLAKAWKEALANEEIHDHMTYWKGRLFANQAASRGGNVGDRKRKSSQGDGLRSEDKTENVDDDEGESLFIKKEFSDPVTNFSDNTDTSSLALSESPSKRTKQSGSTRSSIFSQRSSDQSVSTNPSIPRILLSSSTVPEDVTEVSKDLR